MKGRKSKMARVSKSTMIGELLQIDADVAPILLNLGLSIHSINSFALNVE